MDRCPCGEGRLAYEVGTAHRERIVPGSLRELQRSRLRNPERIDALDC